MTTSLIAHCGTQKVTREELQVLPVPEATRTHKPVGHFEMVQGLIETLSFRHINVVRDEYAVSPDGMKMFGVLDLDYEYGEDVRFSIGIRNANDKSMRLAMTIGYRVFVCDNMAFKGDFMPVFQKHTSRLDLVELMSVGVDKMQRHFEPLQQQIDHWRADHLTDEEAKLIIYEAFVNDGFPRMLLPTVDRHYFHPEHEEFAPRSVWSLSNAFTAAFKELKPMRQFRLTAKLGTFFEDQVKKERPVRVQEVVPLDTG